MTLDRAPLFLDTAYVYALVNSRDEWHATARHWEARLAVSRRRLVTTEFVLAEIADGLATVRFRRQAVDLITMVQRSSLVEVVPASLGLFAAALRRYASRSDKDCCLTDCSSFLVIEERGVSAALTTDEHFRQAGFRARHLDEATD